MHSQEVISIASSAKQEANALNLINSWSKKLKKYNSQSVPRGDIYIFIQTLQYFGPHSNKIVYMAANATM